ncbi:helix-turn-helix domain-containing protein [Effusibacillus consociatus]|uniref:Helix-turn-helix domain-containing protein n=1 Tax=Effusibacillus consociatus TaxID=1117041 RepID=A0ABV9Q1K6_9BACL
MPIGHKIRELRIKRGLTQSDLADGIVTPSMISLIESERANPSEKVLRAIADRLGVPYEEIVGAESSDLEQASIILITKSMLLDEPQAAKTFLLSHITNVSTPDLMHQLLLVDCLIHEGNASKALEILGNLEERHQHEASAVFSIWTKMAHLYRESGNVELASHYWRKAFQVCMQDSSLELQDIVDCVRQMCLFYLEEERYDEVSQILAEFRNRFDVPEDIRSLARSYLKAAVSSQKEKRYRFSTMMAHRAYTLFKSMELFEGMAELQLYESIIANRDSNLPLHKLPRTNHRLLAQISLRNGNLEEAFEFTTQALNEAQTLTQKALALQALAKIQEEQQNYVQAVETIKQMIAIWEELGSSEKVAQSYRRLSHILLRASENI